jgi:hypothetical protein
MSDGFRKGSTHPTGYGLQELAHMSVATCGSRTERQIPATLPANRGPTRQRFAMSQE